MITTRFAPSPTGLLHLGHAYSALFAEKTALDTGGRFLLRIEDIDKGRCRAEFIQTIYDDLAWLGLSWEQPARHQSAHLADYKAAIEQLDDDGLLYPCFCTRNEIKAEISAAGHAPHGPDGPLYPGTCRTLSKEQQGARIAKGDTFALRLKTDRAIKRAGPLTWTDQGKGDITAAPEAFGDVVLARKDTPTSYHLAVTVDDHIQGVNLVTRGEDLFEATHIHRLLQSLLGLDRPDYHHHPLLTDSTGKRYAKRDKSLTLQQLRKDGRSAQDIFQMIGWNETS